MIDLSAFNSELFNGTFDEEAVFTPSGGQARTIRAIFDDVYRADQFREADAGIESSGPRVTCMESDVAGVAHGDTFVLRGGTLHVLEVQPDGFGMVTVLLSKDPLP